MNQQDAVFVTRTSQGSHFIEISFPPGAGEIVVLALSVLVLIAMVHLCRTIRVGRKAERDGQTRGFLINHILRRHHTPESLIESGHLTSAPTETLMWANQEGSRRVRKRIYQWPQSLTATMPHHAGGQPALRPTGVPASSGESLLARKAQTPIFSSSTSDVLSPQKSFLCNNPRCAKVHQDDSIMDEDEEPNGTGSQETLV